MVAAIDETNRPMPTAASRNRIKPDVQRHKRPGEGNVKPKLGDQQDVGRLDEADEHEGSALPAMISTGRNGVTSNWSNVPCSRSRATDMAVSSKRLHHRERADQAGDHVPARFQVRVVPGARR